MVTFEPILESALLVRLCESAPTEADPRPKFTAVAVMEAASGDPTTVWIKGFLGTASRAQLRALIFELDRRGIKQCLAFRNAGHALPMAQVQPDGVLVLDVASLAARAAKDTPSNMLEHNIDSTTLET